MRCSTNLSKKEFETKQQIFDLRKTIFEKKNLKKNQEIFEFEKDKNQYMMFFR